MVLCMQASTARFHEAHAVYSQPLMRAILACRLRKQQEAQPAADEELEEEEEDEVDALQDRIECLAHVSPVHCSYFQSLWYWRTKLLNGVGIS